MKAIFNVAVGNSQVGNFNFGRLPQAHSHTCQVSIFTKNCDSLIAFAGTVTGIQAKLGALKVGRFLILGIRMNSDDKAAET